MQSTLDFGATEGSNFNIIVEDAYVDFLADTSVDSEADLLKKTRKRSAGVRHPSLLYMHGSQVVEG